LRPGLALSPAVGALLDLQGRVRLMVIDYAVTSALMTTMVVLSVNHRLPPPLLLALVAVLAVSNIMSITGARSLFPLMLPRTLWDRANGLDTSSYSLMAIIGPATAGLVVATFGPEAGLLAIAGVAALAALSLVGVAEPIARVAAVSSLAAGAGNQPAVGVRDRGDRGPGWLRHQRGDLCPAPAADRPLLVRARLCGVDEPELCRAADRIRAVRSAPRGFDRLAAAARRRRQCSRRGSGADPDP